MRRNFIAVITVIPAGRHFGMDEIHTEVLASINASVYRSAAASAVDGARVTVMFEAADYNDAGRIVTDACNDLRVEVAGSVVEGSIQA